MKFHINYTSRNYFLIFILALSILVLSACSNEENNDTESIDRPIIAVSIEPQKTFVEAVVGDDYEIIVLIPPGNSPSNYEPTPQEIQKFNDAIVYFSIGVPTEDSNINDLAKENESLKMIPLHEIVSTVYPDVEIAPGQRDSHIWLSPKRVMVMINAIAQTMGELNQEALAQYNENANAYMEQLKDLDAEIISTLKTLENRKFIAFHPAFGYLADDYDMQMYSLEENGKEATPQRIREMIDFAKAENIKAVFYQAEISSKQAESFADEIGAKMVLLDPLSGDYIANLRKMIQLMVEGLK